MAVTPGFFMRRRGVATFGQKLGTPKGVAKRATFTAAVREKLTKYADVEASPLAELLVLVGVVETAGDFVRQLAAHKALEADPLLRAQTLRAWEVRWWAMLGMAAQGALAASLLAPGGRQLVLDVPAAPVPEADTLLDAQRWA